MSRSIRNASALGRQKRPYFSGLMGEQLRAVIFVMDYLQLQFDAYLLTVLTPLTVAIGDKSYNLGEQHYRDRLCERIAHKVTRVILYPKGRLQIGFDDNAEFKISLDPEDYVGPEAINFHFPEEGRMQLVVL